LIPAPPGGSGFLACLTIFLFCDSTRGVDIAAKAGIYEIVRRLASEGKGVIYYSTEHEELVSLCDRVLVFRDGRISGALEGDQLTHHKLLELSFGSHQPPETKFE
jgi:ribose transport system ATP-binding protein